MTTPSINQTTPRTHLRDTSESSSFQNVAINDETHIARHEPLSDMTVASYCTDLYKRTEHLWRSLEGRYPTWKCRFSILYGPPISRPNLLIVGRNPGFNAADLYDEEIRIWPTKNAYTNENWPLAQRLRSLFSAAGLDHLLERSLGTNQLFFKSKSVDRHESGLGWKDNPLDVRREIAAYCENELHKLIYVLKPRAILTLGLSVFDDLATEKSRRVVNTKGRRLAEVGEAHGTKIVGIIHPTGARVSSRDWHLVTEQLSIELGHQRQG